MSKIILLQGLPASGKTTWAKEKVILDQGDTVRVNKDDLREMMFASKWSKDRERQVLNVRDFIVEQSLKEEKNVIIDDTNFSNKHEQRMYEIASGWDDVEIEVVKFDTPLVECLERNKKRNNAVPERIIWDMYYRYILPEKVKNNVYRPNLPNAILVDVDGTVAIHNERNAFEYHKCLSDTPNERVIDIVRELAVKNFVIVVTGRENVHYPVGENYEYPDVLTYTQKWLEKHQVPYDEIYIRNEGDYRPDYVVKKEMWENHIKDRFNILGVFDDRLQVIVMWRELGLQVFDVAGHPW